ncbi:MAG: serine/threonine-protein phosphatase [Anaerolineae bacterium]|nr:serine/threonine-protein phosphatase [Anaerolineae bacterium]
MSDASARPAAAIVLDVGQYSDRGQKRTNNEDWLGVFQPESSAELHTRGSLFLVADGMGGHQSGEIASRLAVDQVIRHFAHDSTRDAAAGLRGAIESANDLLVREAGDAPPGTRWGTTLVAALVRGRELWIANVGDSRAYLLRNDHLRQISVDHTLGGEMAAAFSENWIGRHVVTRALGAKPQVQVDVYTPMALSNRDRIVLCTDGLTGALTEQEIATMAGRFAPQEAATRLVYAANQKGAADNVSVIVIGVSQAGAWHMRVGDLVAMLTQPGGVAEMWATLKADRQLLAIAIGALLLAIVVVVGLGFAIGLLVWGNA